MAGNGIAVVIDYQNVHLVGRSRFAPDETLPDTLVHPGRLADEVVAARKTAMLALGKPLGRSVADTLDTPVTDVFVFRGLPHQERDARGNFLNQAQKRVWEQDPRVVTCLRPLTYQKIDGCEHDPAPRVVPREKGVDVQVAVTLFNLAQMRHHSVIILMSQDSDLTAATELAKLENGALVEAAGWRNRLHHGGVWNTFLGIEVFRAARDTTDYGALWRAETANS